MRIILETAQLKQTSLSLSLSLLAILVHWKYMELHNERKEILSQIPFQQGTET